MAEWLRRSTRNRLGLSRVGSSPASVANFFAPPLCALCVAFAFGHPPGMFSCLSCSGGNLNRPIAKELWPSKVGCSAQFGMKVGQRGRLRRCTMASIEAKTSNQSPRVMKQILQHANWPTGCNFGDPKFWPSGTAHSAERRGRREGVTVANPFSEVDACRVFRS